MNKRRHPLSGALYEVGVDGNVYVDNGRRQRRVHTSRRAHLRRAQPGRS